MAKRSKPRAFDIVVVGGGLIGAALALALHNTKRFTLALIEPSKPAPFNARRFDLRVTALNHFSVNLLKQLAVWDGIQTMRAAPFRKVLVWEEGVSPLVFDAGEIGQMQLGYMVENNVILNALRQKIQASPDLNLIAHEATSIALGKQQAEIRLANDEWLTARLVIGADGYNSSVRQSMDVSSIHLHHAQKALVLHVKTPYAQRDTTWQRFTPQGAQAFLPLPDANASLVWYNPPDYTNYLVAQNKQTLQRHLLQAYPERLEDVRIENWAAFPITSHHVHQYVKDTAVVIGDAAHSVHPLAGQGANLGLQDVAALTKALVADFGPAELAAYASQRRNHNLLFIATLEAIYHGFGNVSPVLSFARKAALWGGRIPPIKQFLMREALGI